ncbi:MAG: DUF6702 family protein [Cyclobacteriaceae bacterium]
MNLLLPYVLVLFVTHPVHVSVTEIEFDQKERELEIVTRIFWDDLERAIRDERKQPDLNLLKPTGTVTSDHMISNYLMSRLRISLNGKQQQVKYLGYEVEGEAIVAYVQVMNVKRFSGIEVFNTVLTELYEDQSNLVHVTVGEEVKSLRLMRDNPSGKLMFETK